jgi:hypothetical protein
MRKHWLIAVTLVLTLSLAVIGCGGKNPVRETPPTDPTGPNPGVLGAIADATIDYGSATANGDLQNSNFGSAATLEVRKQSGSTALHRTKKSYIKFSVAGVDLAAISAARLEFTTTTAPEQNWIHVYGLKSEYDNPTWNESQITWNNAPANDITSSNIDTAKVYGGDYLTRIQNTSPGVYTVDVTDYIKSLTGANATLILIGEKVASSSDLILSKEGAAQPGETRNGPRLLFDYSADKSTFAIALNEPGDKAAGAAFDLSISGAKDVNGANLNGAVHVTVTSNHDGEVHNNTALFTGGNAIVNITLTTAGTHTLTVNVAGVTADKTLPVTVAAPADITLGTVADATIDYGDAAKAGDLKNSNFGSANTLELRKKSGSADLHRSKKAYLKFSVAGVNVAAVSQAQLEFTTTTAPNPDKWIRVYGLKSEYDNPTWNESEITWNNAPANDTVGYTVVLTKVHGENYVASLQNTSPGVYTVDVTDYIKSLTGANATLIVVSEAVASSSDLILSKEGAAQPGETRNGPRLILSSN